jgi:hypothetical protein
VYLLAQHSAGHGLRAQPIVLAPDMENHTFAMWDSPSPDLATATTSFVPIGTGFDPAADEHYARSETVIDGLARLRPLSPAGVPDGGDDPMAQLASGYRLLIDSDHDGDAVERIAARVEGWAPADAAVMRSALLRRSDSVPRGGPAIDVPPLFSFGSDLLSESRADRGAAPRINAHVLGVLNRGTDGSVWSRWRLTRAAEPSLPDDLLRTQRPDDRDHDAVPVASGERNVDVVAVGDDQEFALAAAGPPIAADPAGRHIDLAIWARGGKDTRPVAEIRIRQGAQFVLYQRSGDVRLRYTPTNQALPSNPRDGLVMTIKSGQDIIAHVRDNVRIDRES